MDRIVTVPRIVFIIIIIAIIILIAVFAVTNIKAKANDTRRLSNIGTIQEVLFDINKETNDFTRSGCLSDSFVSGCVGDNLFSQKLPFTGILSDPASTDSILKCSQTCQSDIACDYSFKTVEKENYELHFRLQKGVAGFDAGCFILTPTGIIPIEK